MPTTADPLEKLQNVNSGLRSALARLRPEQNLCSAITPEDFSAITTAILHARECFRELSPESKDAPAFKQELVEYRSNLEGLQQLLPDLHGRLRAEKLRIEAASMHSSAAAAWAGANQKTL